MSEFDDLRRRLRAAGARRRSIRVGDALLLTMGVVTAATYVYYRLDRAASLVVPARLFLDLLWLIGSAWLTWRWVWPAASSREDEIDVALAIERHRADDEDLVAALQFENVLRSGIPTRYGSVALLEAVVERTSARADDFDPSVDSVARPKPWQRHLSTAVLAAATLGIVLHSGHFAAFVQRALLGDAHYPSRTRIESVKINGAEIDVSHGARPRFVVAAGQPVRLELTVGGELPDAASVRLVDAAGEEGVVELKSDESSAASEELRRFAVDAAPPIGSVEAIIEVGDAYTDPIQIVVTPQPAVVVALDVTLPAYAAGADIPSPPPGRLAAAVLEGSRVEVRLTSANKTLKEATLTAEGRRYSLAAEPTAGETGRAWRLDSAGTPLESVAAPLEFTIDWEDIDGFRLAQPLRGEITLRPDQPPTVSADVVTKYVLPAGKPSIAYRADDDLGLSRLSILRQVVRGDGSTTSDKVDIPLDGVIEAAATAAKLGPAPGPRRSVAGKFSLDLASLQLAKGDRVTVRVEALDRADDPDRATAQSEPFTLEVTDEQGLYEAMAETDQRSALKMDEIVKKQETMTGGTATTKPLPIAPLIPPRTTPTPTATPSATAPAPESPP